MAFTSVCGGCSIISYSLFARQPTRLCCQDIVVSRNCLEFCFTHRHVLLINKLLTFLSAKRHILYNKRIVKIFSIKLCFVHTWDARVRAV